MMRSYKFRLYPNKSVEEKLEESLELARLAIQPIAGGNKQGEERRKKNNPEAHTTQALIVKLKEEEKPELKKVYSKALQMVNYQLCYKAM